MTNSQSRSLFQSCGTVLPTSLSYLTLLNRGCQPWSPDAVIGTAQCGNTYALRMFMCGDERTSFLKDREVIPSFYPYLHTICFQGLTMLARTENAFWFSPQLLRCKRCCQTYTLPGRGISNTLPFLRLAEAEYAKVLLQLEPTHPCTNAVHMEPYSSSVFEFRI